MQKSELIFVYNAGSNIFSIVTDYIHKVMAPSTYACSLCALTYNNLSMKKEWKDFIQTLPMQKIFLHKDEFQKQYPHLHFSLPAIFINESKNLQSLITMEEIKNCAAINDLKTLLLAKLSTYDQHYHSRL